MTDHQGNPLEYTTEQYEILRGIALQLKEAEIRADLDIPIFLDVLAGWVMGSADTRMAIIHKDANKARILADTETKLMTVLEMFSTGTLGAMSKMILDIAEFTKEDLTDF